MNARKWAALAAALILWICALCVGGPSAAVTLRWYAGDIDPEQMDRVVEAESRPVRAAIWAEKYEEGRLVAVAHGDLALLIGDHMLWGSASDCAISLKTARALWNAENVVGLEIRVEGRPYTVRGVYEEGPADVLIEWDGASAREFRCLKAAFPGEEAGVQYARAVALSEMLGMGEPNEVLDLPLVRSAADLAARLPGFTLIVLFALWQMRALKGKWARWPLIALASWALWCLATGGFRPPRWLLPTLWSDFQHWEEMASQIASRLAGFLSARHAPVDSAQLYLFLRALSLGLAGSICLKCGWEGIYEDDEKGGRRGAGASADAVGRAGRKRGGGDAAVRSRGNAGAAQL